MARDRVDVMIVTNSLSGGGAERMATSLANLLHHAGLRVVLVAARLGAADLVAADCDVVVLGKVPGSGPSGLVRSVPLFRSLVARLRPRVIHAHCELPELLVSCASTRDTRLVVTEHSRAPWPNRARTGRAVRRALRLRGASWVVLQPGMPVWGVEPTRPPAVIPNPLLDRGGRWTSSAQPGHLRIVGVGRQIGWKRFDRVVGLAEEFPGRVEVTLVGDGEQHEELERLAARRAGGAVNLTGYLTDPWEEALRHDLFVTASEEDEGDPLALGEALLLGLPILASNIAAHRGQGLSGLNLFDTDRDLTDRVGRLLDGSLRLETLVDSATGTRLRQERSPEAILAAHLGAYALPPSVAATGPDLTSP